MLNKTIECLIKTYKDGHEVYLDSYEKDEVISYILGLKNSIDKLYELINHSHLTIEEMERVDEILKLFLE